MFRLIMTALAASMALTPPTLAQTWPARPIRLVVPNAPGGPTDLVARVLAQRMIESMGQQVIVENRIGAGGIVGTESVARAAPDGYAVLVSAAGPMVITPHFHAGLPYDPLRDFVPVALGATAPMILVTPPNGAKSLRELIAQAKARPGRLNYATAGVGTPPHLCAELLKSMAGIDVLHVPYKGTPQVEAAAMNGEVNFTFTQPTILTMAKAGRVRALAISSAKRSSLAPDVPTLAESGLPGFEVTAWYGLFAPSRTPDEIVHRLNAEVMRALRQPEVVERFKSLGFEAAAVHDEREFAAFVRRESVKWQKVVKEAGIKGE